MREEPKPLQVYKHFKGTYYQIVDVAEHSETGEKLVIYRPLFGDGRVFARPLDMFISEVDHEKYPDVKQKYRFALATGPQKHASAPAANDDIVAEQEEKEEKTPDLLDRFLDAKSSEDKLDILTGSWKTITEDNIDNIAVVLDMELVGETLEDKYKEILNCLKMRAKYETSRLR